MIIYFKVDTYGERATGRREISVMTSPPSLKMMATMALGSDDAAVLTGEDWEMRQKLQLDERSALVEGTASVLVSYGANPVFSFV